MNLNGNLKTILSEFRQNTTRQLKSGWLLQEGGKEKARKPRVCEQQGMLQRKIRTPRASGKAWPGSGKTDQREIRKEIEKLKRKLGK